MSILVSYIYWTLLSAKRNGSAAGGVEETQQSLSRNFCKIALRFLQAKSLAAPTLLGSAGAGVG
jgi:hypothetical protein